MTFDELAPGQNFFQLDLIASPRLELRRHTILAKEHHMARRLDLLLAIVPMFCMGCSNVEGRTAPAKAGADDKIDLEIELRVEVVEVRKSVKYTAHLINRGTESVTVPLPGDGSDCGWRTPIVRWQPDMGKAARCGNINALRAAEVIVLDPGKKVELPWLSGPSLAQPGKHKVQLELEHVPSLKWGGLPLGQHDPAAMEKIRNSRPFKVTSQVVEVEIRE